MLIWGSMQPHTQTDPSCTESRVLRTIRDQIILILEPLQKKLKKVKKRQKRSKIQLR